MDFDTLVHDSFAGLTIDESSSGRILDRLEKELNEAEPKSPEIMTIEETAEYLRVTPEVVYELMGEVPCFELGGQVLFRKDAIMEWILKKEKRFRCELDNFESDHGFRLCL